jgi:serine/threonine-protein phosphatase 2A regulatory subunit B
MLPKLNLDGTLKKRTSSVQERMTEEGQPGVYSPRISSSQASKLPAGAANAAVSPSSSASNSPSHSVSGTAALPSPHSSPHENSLVEEGLVGISDPEMATILAAKSRHSSTDRSPTSDRLSAGGNSPGQGVGNSPQGKRRAAPLATLVDHQQARQHTPQASPDSEAVVATGDFTAGGSSEAAGGVKSTTAGGSGGGPGFSEAKRRAGLALMLPRQSSCSKGRQAAGTSGAATSTAAATAATAGATSSSSMVTTMTAEEVYISGKPFHDYMSAYVARAAPPSEVAPAPSSGAGGGITTTAPTTASSASSATATAAAGAHITTTFHQNPSQYISAIASQGDFVAVGDRTGRVVVMRQRDMAATTRRTLLETIQKSEEAEEAEAAAAGRRGGVSTGTSPSPSAPVPPRHIAMLNHVKDPYEFHVAQQAYVPVIDTLNSVEVSPNVTALAFLPQRSPTTYLLTSNEKVPKLYKMMSVRESANSFRAVDKIGTKTIGPLTASSRASTVAMKPVARYALNHEYNIHSICPIAFSDQFATADDATVLLWCTEYPDSSIETFDLRSPYDDGPREAIRCVRAFPHEPFLFFVATSAGTVRVVDTRQTLRWVDQSAQVFSNPTRAEDEPFSNVTNSICDCALSPSGRYIAGRDFMSVCLWDIRMAGSGGARNTPSSPRRATPSPSSPRGEQGSQDCGVVRRWELYPSLRPDLESIYQSNLLFERFDVQFLSGNQVCTGGFNNILYTMNVESTSADSRADIRTFRLPKTENISDFRRTTVSAHTPDEDKANTGQGLGSRMTLMSRPSMSMSASCGMVVACGQAVLQLSYNGVLA